MTSDELYRRESWRAFYRPWEAGWLLIELVTRQWRDLTRERVYSPLAIVVDWVVGPLLDQPFYDFWADTSEVGVDLLQTVRQKLLRLPYVIEVSAGDVAGPSYAEVLPVATEHVS